MLLVGRNWDTKKDKFDTYTVNTLQHSKSSTQTETISSNVVALAIIELQLNKVSESKYH